MALGSIPGAVKFFATQHAAAFGEEEKKNAQSKEDYHTCTKRRFQLMVRTRVFLLRATTNGEGHRGGGVANR